MPNPVHKLLILVLVLSAGGCAVQPVEPGSLRDPALAKIHAAFVRTVEAARNDPANRWHSGWTGNIRVNLSGERDLGLCYQWQAWVYRGVLPTVHEVDWHATGIMINFGTKNEHHAVLVFDPKRVDQDKLLASPRDRPVWVLDAWRRGRADMYRLEDWLELPLIVWTPAKLTLVEPEKQLGEPMQSAEREAD